MPSRVRYRFEQNGLVWEGAAVKERLQQIAKTYKVAFKKQSGPAGLIQFYKAIAGVVPATNERFVVVRCRRGHKSAQIGMKIKTLPASGTVTATIPRAVPPEPVSLQFAQQIRWPEPLNAPWTPFVGGTNARPR